MSVTTPRITWGLYVDATNNRFDFVDNGSTFAATLNYGEYLPAEYATEVQRAMRAANTDNQNNTCTYSISTRKLTITGTETMAGAGFSLLFGTGTNAATDCNAMLGFAASDETGAATYTSDTAMTISVGSSAPYSWAPTDPVHSTTPVSANADGSTATFLQRVPFVSQLRTDGGERESIWFSTDKLLRLQFRWIAGDERKHFETFLDWIERGRRFLYQPDSSSTNAVRLMLRDPGEIAGIHEWLARSEITYPQLTFVESISR